MTGRESRERWYAARQQEFRRKPRRMRGQPDYGFATVDEVMDWLEAHGHIEKVEPSRLSGGEPWWRGWGDPFCAVSSTRDDPWEVAA